MGPEREKGAFSPADRPGSCKGLFLVASHHSPKNTLIFLNYTASVHASHAGDFIHVFASYSFFSLIGV